MGSSELMVSVCCLTYNHESFIRRALEGFVNQKTNFRYEVIVHDDASTDGTADVIREFEEKYPDIIKPIYQTENQYSRGAKISNDFVLPKAQGKYVALCEGDDYWTDENKLQKQVDAMEAHPECHMCVHSVREVYMDETPSGGMFPPTDFPAGVMESGRFIELCQEYNFHTSSFFFRTDEYRQYRGNMPEFARLCPVGDVPCMMYFGQLGAVYYLQETMSCYRRGVPGSWTVRQKAKSADKIAAHRRRMSEVYRSYDAFTQRRYHDFCVKMIGKNLAAAVILEKKAAEMLKKQNREYFRGLNKSRKLYVLASVVFPGAMKEQYEKRLLKHTEAHGV